MGSPARGEGKSFRWVGEVAANSAAGDPVLEADPRTKLRKPTYPGAAWPYDIPEQEGR